MGRIFFFLLLAIAAYVGWQWMKRASLRGSDAPGRRPPAAQAMVKCAHCGLHVPQADALPSGDRYYCSEEHRRRGSAS
ncbi:MAG TPA: PP0621 family protein [Burkholderiaceae bacterium]|nr:PP0621 family protein [Burkholderiaceae bacterium]HQR69474.1 PP0621 family protein [Burkholderiaceae bacterium]